MLSDYEKSEDTITALRFDKISSVARGLGLSAGVMSDHQANYFRIRLNKHVSLGFYYHYSNGNIEVITNANYLSADKVRYERISINVSASRNPISIADDIRRRILNSPEFELNNSALLKRLGEKREADKEEARRIKFLKSQGFICGRAVDTSNEFSRYFYSEKCESSIVSNVRSDSNKIEIRLTSESQYRRLIRLIAKMHREVELEDE